MTKLDLVRRLSLIYPNYYIKDIRKAVDIIFDEISKALSCNQRIELRGFGAFCIRLRKARAARNPKSNAVVYLQNRFSTYFRSGKELKSLLNEE